MIHFDSVTPTFDDLSAYPHIELTADLPWDPHNVNIASMSNGMNGKSVYNNIPQSVIARVDANAFPEDP